MARKSLLGYFPKYPIFIRQAPLGHPPSVQGYLADDPWRLFPRAFPIHHYNIYAHARDPLLASPMRHKNEDTFMGL